MLDAVANNCAVFITTTKMSRYYETFFLAKKRGKHNMHFPLKTNLFAIYGKRTVSIT